jgi:hypothetical protein
MRPGNGTYLMWMGDVVELANTIWGTGSEQTSRLAVALRDAAAAGDDEATVQAYISRLRHLDQILLEFEQDLDRS